MKFRLMQIAMFAAVLIAEVGMHIDGAKWS